MLVADPTCHGFISTWARRTSLPLNWQGLSSLTSSLGAVNRELASRQASDELTEVELETLTLFASGRSYTEIAETRGNSTVTVRNALYRIQEKLGVKTKQELVIWAVRNGLLDDVMT